MGRDKTEAARSRSRGAFRPSYSINFTLLKAEGARKAGWPLHPGAPRKKLREERENHRYRRKHSGLPCAMVYGLYVISSVSQLIATVAFAKLFSFART
jgi:hypothetical protein